MDVYTRALITRTVAQQLRQTTSDRDLIVRDISLDALHRTANHVKLYLLLSALILAPLAVFGVTSFQTFFDKIQPQLDRATSALANTQESLKNQSRELAANKRGLAILKSSLAIEKSDSAILSGHVRSASAEIVGVFRSVEDLARQTADIRQTYVESDLKQDFASLIPGAEHVLIDGRIFSGFGNTLSSQPVVYLTASSGIAGHLTLSEVVQFDREMKAQGFTFMHGNVAVQKGQQSFAAAIVPYAACTQVIYFDRKLAQRAAAVGEMISRVFHLQVPTPFFVDYANNRFWDDTSDFAIKTVGIGIAAAAFDPDFSGCPASVKAEQ